MQGKDTDRLKMDARDYSITCHQCGDTFEATRSDASYCSARCRVRASREPQKRLNALEALEAMRVQINAMARKYKGDPEFMKKFQEIQGAARYAEYTIEGNLQKGRK